MKISIVCHGNIARSQVLHHYLAYYAKQQSVEMELFSCGTAPADAFANVESLLEDVQRELDRRNLPAKVKRDVLDGRAERELSSSDLILVADEARRHDILDRLGDRIDPANVMLFYDYIGEGKKDFVDTYDAQRGGQDPTLFAKCFDELERIARVAVKRIG